MSETGSGQSIQSADLPHNISFGHQTPLIYGMRPGGIIDKPAEALAENAAIKTEAVAAVVTAAKDDPVLLAAIATAQPSGPVIAIINQSTVLPDIDVTSAIAHLQIQLDRDFLPVWGNTAQLKLITDINELETTDWLLALLDNSDQAGALGYHDMTDSGQPMAKVFVATDKQYNLSWTVTTSHELLEMIMDPYISNVIFNQTSNTGGRLYAFEMCDAVEEDNDGYNINGTQVSDFIYPAWFEAFRAANSTKFDHTGKLHKPFDIAAGGYSSVFPIPNKHGWLQVYSQKIGQRLQLKLQRDSRTTRRMRGGLNHLAIAIEQKDTCVDIGRLDQLLAE